MIKKNNTQGEQKVQLIIAIIFRHITDPAKKYTFYVKSKKIDMRAGDDTDEIINKVLDSFFENYEREENILRNGSNYVSYNTIKNRQFIHPFSKVDIK